MLELLSNTSMFKRFLQYAVLTPLVLRFAELVEEQKISDDAKREKVSTMAAGTASELARRGFIPASALEGLEKIAAELYDVAVVAYVAGGFFKERKKVKAKEE